MKKLLLIFLACGFLFVCVSGVQATPIKIGDDVRFTKHGIPVGSIATGGEFDWESADYKWSSFCVEIGEHVSQNTWYDVHDLADQTTTGKALKKETAWLFWKFANDDLTGYNTYDKDETDLQALIWLFQDEITDTTGYTTGTYYDTWKSDAVTATTGLNAWSNDGKVKIVQLWQLDVDGNVINNKIQDQLVLAPVPEPATMVLFGIGLLGLAGIGRKRTQR